MGPRSMLKWVHGGFVKKLIPLFLLLGLGFNSSALAASVACKGFAKIAMPPEGKQFIMHSELMFDSKSERLQLFMNFPDGIGRRRMGEGKWDGRAKSVEIAFTDGFQYGDLTKFNLSMHFFPERPKKETFMALDGLDGKMLYFTSLYRCLVK
jgi:hypothetical protein